MEYIPGDKRMPKLIAIGARFTSIVPLSADRYMNIYGVDHGTSLSALRSQSQVKKIESSMIEYDPQHHVFP